MCRKHNDGHLRIIVHFVWVQFIVYIVRDTYVVQTSHNLNAHHVYTWRMHVYYIKDFVIYMQSFVSVCKVKKSATADH